MVIAKLAAEIEIVSNARVFLVASNQEIDISTEFPLIVINRNHDLLLGQEKKYKYYQWKPADNRRCVVNVMNQREVLFSVRINKDVSVVNKKIRVCVKMVK